MKLLNMNSRSLIRVGAVAAIFAGVFIAGHPIPTIFDGNPMDLNSLADYLMESIFGAGYVALLILFLALTRLHTVRRVQSYGRLGRVGVYMALVGTVLVILKQSLVIVLGAAFGVQAVMDILVVIFGLYIVGSSLVGLGQVLLGVAVLRSRVLPLWFGLALIIVPLALFVVPFISGTLAGYEPYVEGLFWIAIGYGLWSFGRREEREETVRPVHHRPAVVE
jgi:hypothetical protein